MNTRTNTRILSVALALMLASPSALAEVSDEQFQALMEQLQALTERVTELESANADLKASNAELVQSTEALTQSTSELQVTSQETTETVAALSEAEDKSSWTERIEWKGDFRTRYEFIDQDGDDRTRVRIRARPAVIAQVNDTVEVGFGMATGGDDPVSTNQTLGGGGSSKDVRLDLAYFAWDTPWDGVELTAGKFKNPLVRAGGWGLLWDGDWRPEGTELHWDNDQFFLTGVGNWLESDSKGEDEFAYLLQGGMRLDFGDSVDLLAGVGYYQFDTAGKGSFFGDDNDFFGNSFNPITNTYLYDYHLIEVFAELGFDLFGTRAKLWADYVHNTEAPDLDTGYVLGLKFGSAKKKGQWDTGVFYQDLEADATLGLLSDSDFGGGGTDVRGWAFKGTYVIADNWNFKATYFLSENRVSSADPRDFDRLMLDLNFKW